jgi:hypothetical protein
VPETKALQHTAMKEPLPEVNLKAGGKMTQKLDRGHFPNKELINNIVSACYVSQNEEDPFNKACKSLYAVPPFSQQKKLFKELDVKNYVEEHLCRTNEITYDFLHHMDPNMDPTKIFALYFYNEGSYKQYKEMQTEIIDQLKADEKNKVGEKLKLEKFSRRKMHRK